MQRNYHVGLDGSAFQNHGHSVVNLPGACTTRDRAEHDVNRGGIGITRRERSQRSETFSGVLQYEYARRLLLAVIALNNEVIRVIGVLRSSYNSLGMSKRKMGRA